MLAKVRVAMRTCVMALMFALFVAPASAKSYLSGQKLTDTVSGRTFTWPDGSKSTYNADGHYVFSGRSTVEGVWEVKGAWVCVTFHSGKAECGKYFYRNSALYARTAAGKIYRAR